MSRLDRTREYGAVVSLLQSPFLLRRVSILPLCSRIVVSSSLMVAVGSKALPSRRPKTCGLVQDSLMGEDDKSHRRGRRKQANFDSNSNKRVSGKLTVGSVKDNKFSKPEADSGPQKSFVRKQVDPETVKYFSEIANLFESKGVDLDERVVICANALEETWGKELQLATDYYISHTLQTLLEGCDVDNLCAFLRSCVNDFPYIAMDRSGSHVAETAIKSLARHLQDKEYYHAVEDTLTMICKVVVENPADLMCDCYGSHVLRSLLALCGGASLDSSEFHVTKASKVLAERFSFKESHSEANASSQSHGGFPDLLQLLVSEMLKGTKKHIKALLVDQYSSLVLQTALKLLRGYNEELLKVIPILLGCNKEDIVEGDSIKISSLQNIRYSMKETAYSHLMEVILEVAPKVLYEEMFTKIFRNSLFELSSHHCGNFVVQALISHASNQDQIELIWEELGPKFKDLLELGRSGVVASTIAACQRLHKMERQCCEALAGAVRSMDESATVIVPRILFLDRYFSCEDKASWNWPQGAKIHVIGSLILQEIFRFQTELVQPYIISIASMEADNLLDAAKDTGGARVVEAFLSSEASPKMKNRLIMRLQGHFGELALHSSGSFTVEKCFNAANMSKKELIVSELSAVHGDLFKTKQGPYLLRKLDVDGYIAQPDQWRSRQESKLAAYKEFRATFGYGENKPSKSGSSLSNTSKKTSKVERQEVMVKESRDNSDYPAPFLSTSGHKRKPSKGEERTRNKKSKKDRDQGGH